MTTMAGAHRQARAEPPQAPDPTRHIGPAGNGRQRENGVYLGYTPKPRRRRDLRKQDPDELRAFLTRVLRAYARRVAAEDPGVLADLLDMADKLHDLANEVGREQVKVNGPSLVAQELTRRGRPTTRMMAWKRWGRPGG